MLRDNSHSFILGCALFGALTFTACVTDPGSSEPPDAGETESDDDGTNTSADEVGTETGSEAGSETGSEPITCEGFDEADYDDVPATFELLGDGRAIMAGYIDGSTPAALASLLNDNPDLELLIMPFVPGSADDVANLQAGRMLHAAQVATCVPSTGLIASGGVDFFLAGSQRVAPQGAMLGVHSWATGGGIEGGELPMDHPEHSLYLDYYADIGIDGAFYWFTLEAAPSDGIHWMTPEEMATYGVLTER